MSICIVFFVCSAIAPRQFGTLMPYTTLSRSQPVPLGPPHQRRGQRRRVAHLGADLGDQRDLVDEPGIETTRRRDVVRSEEHTSELQSPCNLVCRLLLEKKKEKP